MIIALGILLPHVTKIPGVKQTLKAMISYLKKARVPAKNALLRIFKKGKKATVKLFADAEKGVSHGLNIFEDLGGDFLESAGEIVESAYVLGLKGKELIVDFAKASKRILGNEVGSIGRIDEVTDSLKAGNGLYSKIGKVVSKDTLNSQQLKNLKRFEDKLPKGSLGTELLSDGKSGHIFRAEVPGNVPGSKAIYEKHIDSSGKTLDYFKTTYDNKGDIVHIKDKINGDIIDAGDI